MRTSVSRRHKEPSSNLVLSSCNVCSFQIRQSNGHVTCDVCTAFQGIQRLTVSKRAGVLYQRARTRKDGELFPLDMKPIATEDVFNVFTDGQVIDQEDKS